MAVDHYYAVYADGTGAGQSIANIKAGTGAVDFASSLSVADGVEQTFTATGLTASTFYDFEYVLTTGGGDQRATTVNHRTKAATGSVVVLSSSPIVRQ